MAPKYTSRTMGRSPHRTDCNRNLHDELSPKHNHLSKISRWNFQESQFYRGIFHFLLIFAWALQCKICDLNRWSVSTRSTNTLLTMVKNWLWLISNQLSTLNKKHCKRHCHYLITQYDSPTDKADNIHTWYRHSSGRQTLRQSEPL